MKKTVFFLSLFVVVGFPMALAQVESSHNAAGADDSVMRQNSTAESMRMTDSTYHNQLRDRLSETDDPHVKARCYYYDFVYINGGYCDPYFPFTWNDVPFELRTPTFSHSADSALHYLRHLYHERKKNYFNEIIDNVYMYYPICQLERYLGLAHDPSILPPDTSGFYVPLQSGTYANLGEGWQTDYSQHLLPYADWAVSFGRDFTHDFKELQEPSVWLDSKKDMSMTMFRMIVFHLPGTGYTMVRAGLDNGRPYAVLKHGYSEYSDTGFVKKQGDSISLRLTHNQWSHLLQLTEGFDTLPWRDRGTAIDGNRYFFEYAHNGHYHSHFTCGRKQTDTIAHFLYGLFDKSRKSVVGRVYCTGVSPDDIDGVNIPVTVEVRNFWGRLVKTVETDISGTAGYFYIELPVGRYRFTFLSEGYEPYTTERIRVKDHCELDDACLRPCSESR